MGNFWNTKVNENQNKLYKQMIKSKTKQNKPAKFEAYRKYCNKITDLLNISRQSY